MNNSTKFSSPPRVMKSSSRPWFLNRTEKLRHAIDIIFDQQNNVFNSFKSNYNNLIPDHRTNQINPNNMVFFDEKNKKVYKIAPWKEKRYININNNEIEIDAGIINEFRAYKILSKYNETNRIKHVPIMYACKIIPNTQFALLVISLNMEIYQKKANLAQIKNKLNETGTFIQKADNYLRNKGIRHLDLPGNVYKTNSNKDFFIIDFEQCSFTENANEITQKEINKMTKNVNNIKTKKSNKYKNKYSGIKPLNFGPNNNNL